MYNNVLDLNGKHWSITLKFSFINIYDQVGSSSQLQGPDYFRPTIEESIGQNNLEYMKRQAQIVQNSDYSNLSALSRRSFPCISFLSTLIQSIFSSQANLDEIPARAYTLKYSSRLGAIIKNCQYENT